MRWFRTFCRHGSSSFDGGAREGYVALLLARLSAGRGLAIEADPGEFEWLRHNLALDPALVAEGLPGRA